jgi:Family of unknown function (DUF6516)
MADAVLIYHDKAEWPDGHIVEMTIWRLPQRSAERPHGLKYSLFYGRPGERIIGYDNEAGKGDHRHFRDSEISYVFVDVESLIADFIADVNRLRGEA